MLHNFNLINDLDVTGSPILIERKGVPRKCLGTCMGTCKDTPWETYKGIIGTCGETQKVIQECCEEIEGK